MPQEPTNESEHLPASHYRPVLVTIVAAFVAILATKHALPHFIGATAAMMLQNMVWFCFGVLVYRNALITGVLDHLGEARRLFHRYTQHNTEQKANQL
ncbi:hypothetical protein ABU614_10750 [Lysobacter firmicutimachus]|uniref:Uncharacterized protein n=1 Tax=Lysobacter firmicutimachus TaxID=1792846 RepID=A0AAU8MXP6_9GAMM